MLVNAHPMQQNWTGAAASLENGAGRPRQGFDPAMRTAMTEHEKTRLVHTARDHIEGDTHAVNPPIMRTSTVLYKDVAVMKAVRTRREQGERIFSYGSRGKATTF